MIAASRQAILQKLNPLRSNPAASEIRAVSDARRCPQRGYCDAMEEQKDGGSISKIMTLR
jgi:hypothetical protein